jgi:CheY-like chemotaxis protein
MPHMTGMALHEHVSRANPALALRFVFLSGDLSRSDIREYLERVPNERIEKPFNIQELRALASRLVQGG